MAYNDYNPMEYARRMAESVQEEYVLDRQMVSDLGVKRGLRNADGTGVLAGITRIGSVQGYYMEDGMRVPMEGKLYYRGIDVREIVEANRAADRFGYEEVAYLLLMGQLPDSRQLEDFTEVLSKSRPLPEGFVEDVILKIPSKNVMNKIASCILALYTYDENPDDLSLENMLRISIELIGRLPLIAANAYAVRRHKFEGRSLYIHQPREHLSMAENFLRLARPSKQYTHSEAKLLDTMLMLHAEHGGGNNSTFVCRALSSTGTDTYSAVAGAVSSLKGPLHGGANAKVMEMFRDIREHVEPGCADAVLEDYLNRILDGEAGDRSGKIYGLGHAVYTMSDPRAVMLRTYAREVAVEKGMEAELSLMESVERLGIPLIMERKKQSSPMCANVDLYSGFIYSMLGIPVELYTPLFASARVAGWCAHRIEEVLTGGRIMRPAYRAANLHQHYIPLESR